MHHWTSDCYERTHDKQSSSNNEGMKENKLSGERMRCAFLPEQYEKVKYGASYKDYVFTEVIQLYF